VKASASEKETLFVSFSGGRTSGYMCWWLIEYMSHKYNFIFVFANTGLEHEKTYEFVDKCDKHFGLNLVWVEAVVHPDRRGCTHETVNYKIASRNGLPFEEVIKKYGIPNTDYPHCTRELKLNPMFSYKQSLGFKRNHPMAVGIRADEVDRVSDDAKNHGVVYPLVTAGVTLADVRHWWVKQPFDLEIPEHLGNCVTCWKKSDRKLLTLARHSPHYFNFFDRMEKEHPRAGHTGENYQDRVFFRKRRSTQDILREAKTPFVEFSDQMPPLQLSIFDPMDIEEDCGAGCEIG
jgi:hypothetical protein